MSNQIDIVLYSRAILPPAVYSQTEGFFPVESCLYTIEVKSRLTAGEIRKAIDNSLSCHGLSHLPTRHISGTTAISAPTAHGINVLFAFDTDLAPGSSELDRYLGAENAIVDGKPAIQVICVAGRGYWTSDPTKPGGWTWMDADEDHNEIMMLLAGISNTLPLLIAAKGRPCFGHYLVQDR